MMVQDNIIEFRLELIMTGPGSTLLNLDCIDYDGPGSTLLNLD